MNEENRTLFGHMPDGTAVGEIVLTDGALSCGVITYGGALRFLTVPGQTGGPVDVVLGFDTLEDYIRQDKYMGALVGRYGNRIGGSRFALEGQEYPLRANDGPNHLHGGPEGFDKKVWQVRAQTRSSVSLSLFSPDGEEGYPGNLEVTVTYTLRGQGLEIAYRARSSRTTLCNLTNHAYFNLSGHGSGSIEGQHIQLPASRYTPVGEGLIPTGAVDPVEGTPMDLRTAQPIGAHIGDPFDQLVMARGYDHNWVIDGYDDMAAVPAARAWSPETGICLEAATTQPGVQFYTGNYVGGCPAGKGGAAYGDRHGFCLETQCFPDSPNKPNFSPWVLRAGSEYRSGTVYRFSIIDRADQL